ncbi:MAG: zf-HC2 domain-containing protein [Gemmatimonadetes bacterium]|nr:zf-HC2 domain-containing protein [Gemmatimonadota bacterium]
MMRDCENGEIRDLLPLYAAGTVSQADRATVEAHLSGCADCASELELLDAARRAYPAPAVELGAVARRVAMASQVRSSKPYYRQPLWRAAASITLFIVGAAGVVIARQAGEVGSGAGGQALVQPLDSVIRDSAGIGVVGPADVSTQRGVSLGPSLADLSDAQIEALLASLDGLDVTVRAEPDTFAVVIVPDGGVGTARGNR